VRETVLHGDASFVEADITGGLIERVYNLTPRTFFKKRIDVCSLLDFSTWMPAEGTEMVISLNVMTQLAALPVDY
jgi:cbb3-type cytochrome oxidase subunit 1